MEIWKDVVGYEGLYEVSNLGNIRNYETKRNLKPLEHAGGYVKVILHGKDGKQKNVYIHRVVAIAFIENDNMLPQVNHKDENKRNNNAENLEWCSALYNMNYGTGHKRSAEKQEKEVSQYDLSGNKIKTYGSVKKAQKDTGIGSANIQSCCLGRSKTAGGYVWKY